MKIECSDFLREHFSKDAIVFKSDCSAAIIDVLKTCKIKSVILPSFTCIDLLYCVDACGCDYFFADCRNDLQIDPLSIRKIIERHSEIDAVIVPHMFGISADLKEIRDVIGNRFIIEDVTQSFGLRGIGIDSDFVVCGFGKSKWMNVGFGGVLACNSNMFDDGIDSWIEDAFYNRLFEKLKMTHDYRRKRIEIANKIKDDGVNVIENELDNVYLRCMYMSDDDARIAYNPLHRITGRCSEFCKNTNDIFSRINWRSVII